MLPIVPTRTILYETCKTPTKMAIVRALSKLDKYSYICMTKMFHGFSILVAFCILLLFCIGWRMRRRRRRRRKRRGKTNFFCHSGGDTKDIRPTKQKYKMWDCDTSSSSSSSWVHEEIHFFVRSVRHPLCATLYVRTTYKRKHRARHKKGLFLGDMIYLSTYYKPVFVGICS